MALCACCVPHVLKSNVTIFWLTVFWGGRGEMRNPAMELFLPPFLVYDRLGLGVGALIEVCQGGSIN